MVTRMGVDFIVLFVLFLVIVVAASLWPPHRHHYTTPTGEIYQRTEHRFEVRQCVCGKTKDFVTYTGAHNA